MASIYDFTSPDQIRAALGVSSEELTDDAIGLPLYLTNLQEDLRRIAPTLVTQYVAAKSLVTAEAVRFVEVVSMYATLQVAYQLRGALHTLAPRTIGDGKATMQRFLDPIPQVIEALRADLSAARISLNDAYAAFLGSTSSQGVKVVLMAGARPTYNPITGE